jgi:hypothetical protein
VTTRRTAFVGLVGCGLLLVSAGALAQRFDARRPQTLTVGAPQGDAPADRVDARRTGFARSPLPTATLRAVWRRAVGVEVEDAPLVGPGGEIVVIAMRGDVATFAPDGLERRRVSAGLGAPGPGAFLSNGTVVVVNGAGEAVGIRDGVIRFRTHVGERNTPQKAAPLALDDGGVVVGVGAELTSLDAEGNVRARAALPEPPVWPLLPALGKVVAITSAGAAYLWTPGREPVLAGTFGGALEGGALAADDHTLLAIVEGTHLLALDLERGVTATRTLSTGGLFLGPPSLRGTTTHLLALTVGAVFATSLDAAGQELTRNVVETSSLALLTDGGAAPLVAPTRTPTLVDAAGTMAFGTPDGHVGVVTASGDVETLGEAVCTATRGPRWPAPGSAPGHTGTGFAGFAPAGAGGFVVLCESGQLARIAAGD